MSFFSKLGDTFKGVVSGAGAGSIFGPVGAGVGAVIGGAGGLLGGSGGSSSVPNTSAAFYAPPMGPTSFRNTLGEVNKDSWRDFKDELRSGVSSGFFTPDQAYQMAITGKSGPSKFSSSFLSYEPDPDILKQGAFGALKAYGYEPGSKQEKELMKSAKAFGIRDAGAMSSLAQNLLALDPANRYKGPLSAFDEKAVSMYGPMVEGDNIADKTYKYTFNVKRNPRMA